MENKKDKIISIGAVVALALTVITATYAYFNAQVGDPAVADIKVNANTVDTFTFSNGSAISFSINQDNCKWKKKIKQEVHMQVQLLQQITRQIQQQNIIICI